MKEKLKKLKEKLNLLYKRGFFHIFTSSVLNKIMQFCAGIFVVRILSKGDFGIYSYSQNLLSLFLLINGFGISDALMQFGSKAKNEAEKNEYIKYSIKVSMYSNILICLSIILYSLYGKFKIQEARYIFLLMLFIPVINIIFTIIQLKLRIELKNKEMSKISNINTFFNLFGMIIGGKIYGVVGLIVGKYIGNIFSISISFKYIKEIIFNWKNIVGLSKESSKNINKYAFVAMLNNGVASFIYIADIFLIGIIIGDKDILASYKTATLIPFALSFIPMSVMVYIYPYFAKNSENFIWIRNKYKELIKYLFILNILISMFLVFGSKYIILLLFGEKYLDSLKPFIVLSIGYFFAATFRIPAGNILAALGKIKFNFYNTIISGSLNIILDIFLIKKYGSIGAAYATVSVFVVSGIIGNIFVMRYVKNK